MCEAVLSWGLFVRGLAAVQAFALLDLSTQVLAFGGSRGIVPVNPPAKFRVSLHSIRMISFD
jgi:hypothetical protein